MSLVLREAKEHSHHEDHSTATAGEARRTAFRPRTQPHLARQIASFSSIIFKTRIPHLKGQLFFEHHVIMVDPVSIVTLCELCLK
jgi:hypothetical protein